MTVPIKTMVAKITKSPSSPFSVPLISSARSFSLSCFVAKESLVEDLNSDWLDSEFKYADPIKEGD